MSWAAFLPSNVQAHPESFIGPNIMGTIVQALETGIVINQSVRFWSLVARTENKRLVTTALVVFVTCVALFQTIIAVYNTWRVAVLGFGNTTTAVFLGWTDRIQPALNCAMSTPFQAFLIWQCWNVLQRRWIVLVPLVTLLLASVIMNVYITVNVFYKYGAPILSIITELGEPPPRSFVTAFVLTAVLDMCITLLMMWFLLRIKSQVVSQRLAKTIARLHRLAWEAAVPPCACAITACVVYITMSQKNLWDIFWQSILGKLYVISLFVLLNGRAELKRSRFTSMSSSSRYWVNGPPVQFRVNLTTAVDQHMDTDVELTPTEIIRYGPAVTGGNQQDRGHKPHVPSCDPGRTDDVAVTVHDDSFVVLPLPTVSRRSSCTRDRRLSL